MLCCSGLLSTLSGRSHFTLHNPQRNTLLCMTAFGLNSRVGVTAVFSARTAGLQYQGRLDKGV